MGAQWRYYVGAPYYVARVLSEKYLYFKCGQAANYYVVQDCVSLLTLRNFCMNVVNIANELLHRWELIAHRSDLFL